MAEWFNIVGRVRRVVSGGTPEHPIVEPQPPVDPDYGIDIDAPHPSHPIVLPTPPPGIWPPPTVEHPIVPLPPTSPLPPGEIWPPPGPLPSPEHPIALPPIPPGKFVVLVYIPGMGYKYVVVDPSLKPTPVAK